MANKNDGNIHSGHRQRMKSKFLSNGPSAFHDHELLSMLLFYAIPQKDTNPLAHKLIDKYGSLAKVFRADPYDLAQVDGVGMHTATLLSLISSLSDRMRVIWTGQKISLVNAERAMNYCAHLLSKAREERVYALSLDKSFNLIHAEEVSIGTIDRAAMYERTITASAVRHNAVSVILAHNHPSMDIQPSRDDIDVSKRISMALRQSEIGFSDHIIVGVDNAYSMSQNVFLANDIMVSGEADMTMYLGARTYKYLKAVAEHTRKLCIFSEHDMYCKGDSDIFSFE